MSIFYVCQGYDEYDPNTGLFVFKTDCIEWNTDTMGPFNGPTYQSQSECYEQSICAPSPITNTSNPTSSCQIKEISLVDKNNDTITVNIQLFQDYDNAYIEYALYDIDQNLIQDFSRLNIKSNILLSNNNYTINIKNINNSLGGCPSTISLSGWEAVRKTNLEPGVPPSQWINPPDFIYKNINGTYTNLGIDANGYAWYRSDNYGRWDLENNNWNYTPNVDSGPYSIYGNNYIIDRWYLYMTLEPFPITSQYAWGIVFGEKTNSIQDLCLLAWGTPGEACPIDINLSNLILDPLPTNIDDPTKKWSGIIKIGDILGEDGSGSESGFDICRLAFRLIVKCPNESGGSGSGSESGGGGGGGGGGGDGGDGGGDGGGSGGSGGGGTSGGGDGNTGISVTIYRGKLGMFTQNFATISGETYTWYSNATPPGPTFSTTTAIFQNLFDNQTILVRPLNFAGMFMYPEGWTPESNPANMYDANLNLNITNNQEQIIMQIIGGSPYFVLPPNKQLRLNFGDTIYDMTGGNSPGFGPATPQSNSTTWTWLPQT